jgi:hypothetical protein
MRGDAQALLGRALGLAGPSGWAARPSSPFLLFFSIFHFFSIV